MQYLRVFFIMTLSFLVVLVGTIAIADTEVPVAERNGAWLLVFVLLVIATVLAAMLYRRR